MLSTTPPRYAFNTTVPVHAVSSCHAAIQPTGCPAGVMETKFMEYATAAGTPQLEDGTETTRACPAMSDGAPNAPVLPEPPAPRVSMTRHGVMAINTKPPPLSGAAVDEALTALIGQFLTTRAGCAKTAGIKTAAPSVTALCSRTLRSIEQMDR